MRRAVLVLCLLLVAVPVAAQSFSDVLGFVISNAIGDAIDAWKIYRVIQACDYDNQTVREFAMDHARPGEYSIVQVCDIFDAVMRPRWRYYTDAQVVGDFYVSASVSIYSDLRGDCDDFAIVIASCIRSIGGACRIAFVHNDGRGHALAEVYVGSTTNARKVAAYIFKRYGVQHVFFDFDGNQNCWLTLDWAGTPPTWSDAHPGKTPLYEPAKAQQVLYAPIFNLLDAGNLSELPVP